MCSTNSLAHSRTHARTVSRHLEGIKRYRIENLIIAAFTQNWSPITGTCNIDGYKWILPRPDVFPRPVLPSPHGSSCLQGPSRGPAHRYKTTYETSVFTSLRNFARTPNLENVYLIRCPRDNPVDTRSFGRSRSEWRQHVSRETKPARPNLV